MLFTNAQKTDLETKEVNNNNLCETFYCDYSYPLIKELSGKFKSKSGVELIKEIFLYVRDSIIFGGDHWKIKASETLRKGYGACYNKNVLFIALLRAAGLEAKLMANPLKKTFTKPSAGASHIFFSNPFYHCYTNVLTDSGWVSIDPTLDSKTYETFFKTKGVNWGIDWDGKNDMLLYTEYLAGSPVEYQNMDEALSRNLNSYFLFRYEPKNLRSIWLKIGNMKMWKKTKREIGN
ncbi:MAG: transglutaminase family protein [Deltaproteobacteria bacterium]|nr:transglutaminase family protein [Deltaproteobacteria bacterium]